LERRAIQKAKHLIGLKRQEVALQKRQQGQQHDQGRTKPSGDQTDRPSVERSQRDAVAAEAGDHLFSDAVIHTAAGYINTISE
jgi:nucleoside-diphosphate-sugar epimerase